MLLLTLIFIFEVDTFRFIDVDPEREKIWRIILSLFSILIIFLISYLTYLRLIKGIKKIQLIALSAALFGGILSISIPYLGYQGFQLTFFFILRSFFIGYLFALVYDWYRKSLKQKDMEKQKLQSELTLLRNQINPHFLFNTLNNIDSLIKSNPPKASASLVGLSDIMRYMVYETNVEFVPLYKELEYIENYLELQKLHFSNLNLVDYHVKGSSENINIPPMLFIPFIENAFKHCNNKEMNNAIRFTFEVSTKEIIFAAENIADKKHLITKDKSSGVGLDIVKRRLEIIYPNRHKLEIKEEKDLFCVFLKIKLDD